jgi:hypothetical protein
MTRDQLIEKLSTVKLDPAYADQWFVLFGDVNARDHGATYVQLDEFGFSCTSIYPATYDDNDCDLVTSWHVSEYSGGYKDLINVIDTYISLYNNGDLPSLTGFLNTLIDTYIGDGLGHNDTFTTTEPNYLFSVNGSIPALAFHLD